MLKYLLVCLGTGKASAPYLPFRDPETESGGSLENKRASQQNKQILHLFFNTMFANVLAEASYTASSKAKECMWGIYIPPILLRMVIYIYNSLLSSEALRPITQWGISKSLCLVIYAPL